MSIWKISKIQERQPIPCDIDGVRFINNIPSKGRHFFDCPECNLIHSVDIDVLAGTSTNAADIDGTILFQCYKGQYIKGNHCTELNLTEIYVRSDEGLLADEKEVDVECDICHSTHRVGVANWISPLAIPDNAVWGEIVENDPMV